VSNLKAFLDKKIFQKGNNFRTCGFNSSVRMILGRLICHITHRKKKIFETTLAA
jgi:hypothetical protein